MTRPRLIAVVWCSARIDGRTGRIGGAPAQAHAGGVSGVSAKPGYPVAHLAQLAESFELCALRCQSARGTRPSTSVKP